MRPSGAFRDKGGPNMQLELLWNYMQYDMEADRFENAMRNAPDRVKLLKQRDFLLEQQNTVKRIERETANGVHTLRHVSVDKACPASVYCTFRNH
jgi:hypothetical protein